jgi:hypothetical protein
MKKLIAIFLFTALLTPTVAFAQINACKPGTIPRNAATNPQIGQCVNQIYLWALGAAGALALIMMIYGGYEVMTAAGNAQRATNGKSYIYSSLIGILILLGAYLLLSVINPDLTKLEVNTNCLTVSNANTPNPNCPSGNTNPAPSAP